MEQKKTVSAKAIVADIKAGVDDFELMRRYGLPLANCCLDVFEPIRF